MANRRMKMPKPPKPKAPSNKMLFGKKPKSTESDVVAKKRVGGKSRKKLDGVML
jgi:hypothetical protein